MKPFHISRILLPIKLHYFLFFGGLACTLQFLPVYAEQLGLSHAAITFVYTILPFTVILTKPVVGNIADRIQKHKLVFLGSIVLSAVSSYVIYFVPDVTPSRDVNLFDNYSCDNGNDSIFLCSNQISSCSNSSSLFLEVTCKVQCSTNTSEVVSCLSQETCKTDGGMIHFASNFTLAHFKDNISCIPLTSHNRNVSHFCVQNDQSKCELECSCFNSGTTVDFDIYKNLNFILLFVLLILIFDSVSIAISIGDTIVADVINEVQGNFGHQRVYGTVGWGIMSIIVGKIYEVASKGKSKTDYTIGIYIMLAALILDFLICTQIKVIHQPKPEKILKNIIILSKDKFLCIFTLAVFVVGLLTGTLWTFLFIYVNEMEPSPLLLGLIPGVQCFGGELLFLVIAGWIVNKIGHLYSMTLSLVCYGIRYVAYSLIENPWIILPLELLQGPTFGLFLAAMVSFASVNAPPGMTATMQTWLQTVFEGIGIGFGNLVSGLLYSNCGGRKMFLILGISSFIFSFFYTMAVFMMYRLQKKDDLQNERQRDTNKKH